MNLRFCNCSNVVAFEPTLVHQDGDKMHSVCDGQVSSCMHSVCDKMAINCSKSVKITDVLLCLLKSVDVYVLHITEIHELLRFESS